MANSNAKATRAAKMEKRFGDLTDAHLAKARAILEGMPAMPVRIGKTKTEAQPIPMQGGKYGWFCRTEVEIDGVAETANATLTFVHPAADGDDSDLVNVAMHKLAVERKESLSQSSKITNVAAALEKLPAEEQMRILQARLAALQSGDVPADDDDSNDD